MPAVYMGIASAARCRSRITQIQYTLLGRRRGLGSPGLLGKISPP